MFYMKIYRWVDSNRGPLVSQATALPTEPQPLPQNIWLFDDTDRLYVYLYISRYETSQNLYDDDVNTWRLQQERLLFQSTFPRVDERLTVT